MAERRRSEPVIRDTNKERDMTDAPTLVVNATYRVHADDVNAFKALASRMAAVGSTHDGCAFLTAAQDTADPTTFYTFEGWRDQAALGTAATSDDIKSLFQEAGALKVTDRTIVGYTVSDSKPLDLPS